MVFDRSPKSALVHYEVGVRIGELSLGAGEAPTDVVLCVDEKYIAHVSAAHIGDPRILPFCKRIDARKLLETCERLVAARRANHGVQ